MILTRSGWEERFDATVQELLQGSAASADQLQQRIRDVAVKASEGREPLEVIYCAQLGGFGFSEAFVREYPRAEEVEHGRIQKRVWPGVRRVMKAFAEDFLRQHPDMAHLLRAFHALHMSKVLRVAEELRDLMRDLPKLKEKLERALDRVGDGGKEEGEKEEEEEYMTAAYFLLSVDMGRFSRSFLSSSVIPKLHDFIRRAETREFEPGLLSQLRAAYEADGCLDAGAADVILRKALEIAETGDIYKEQKQASGTVQAAWLDAFLVRGYEDIDAYSYKQSSFHVHELSATARMLASLNSESQDGAAIRGYDLGRVAR